MENNISFDNEQRKNQNLEIIDNLNKKLQELNFNEIERKLGTLKFDETKENLIGDIDIRELENLVWNVMRFNSNYIDKVVSVNLKVINCDNFLYNIFMGIQNHNNLSYDISWVNNPINSCNPYIQEFYRELQENYKNKYFYYRSQNCFLKVNLLNGPYQQKLHILNLYLMLLKLITQIEKIINFLICINDNYLN